MSSINKTVRHDMIHSKIRGHLVAFDHDAPLIADQNINSDESYYVQANIVREYDNKTFVLYAGFREDLANGCKRFYPEVSVYQKEFDANGQPILYDKFRLERNEEIQNFNSYVTRDSFYINDLDNDGNEEIIIQMTNDCEMGAGLAVFNGEGIEITDVWFDEGDNLGNFANGFHFVDLNNDDKKDIIMVSAYSDNYNETILFLNNGEKFKKKVLETDHKWNFPIDSNGDNIYEIMTSSDSNSKLYFLDYSNALSINEFENDIKIYPNPSFDYIKINADSNLEAILYDSLGKELIRKNVTDKLDISQLKKGTYILNLSNGVNTSTHKIIKE